jgi:succinate dehydrogenase/fumarate reductase flavoprotein subunit
MAPTIEPLLPLTGLGEPGHGHGHGEAAQQYSNLRQCLKRRVVMVYDTLETLASAQSMNLKTLSETVQEYNRSVDQGMDTEFGKPLPDDTFNKILPPYYLVRLKPKIHYCNGGIQINPRAQVMNIEDHQPIPRLYAAGEVTGGVHGASRISGMSICECLVFGRIAGINVAQEAQVIDS